MPKLSTISIALGAAVLSAAPISLRISPENSVSLSLDSAGAVIGRPLTPMSIAGVHRRAMRRTYGVGANLGYHPVARAALYGAAAAGAGYYGAGYGYGAPSYAGFGWRGWGQNLPGNLYSYAPGVSATSQETTADAQPSTLNPDLHAYCMSRTFNAGPC